MAKAGILGMRVLWFEQEQDGRFRPPRDWSRDATAMTTTHDLPTVAGWWQGRDIDWRDRARPLPRRGDGEREEAPARRATAPRCGRPSCDKRRRRPATQPGTEDTEAVVDAALAHVGGAACALAILPLEDALGLAEQPNLPGTIEEHPNWRRRLPGDAATLLDDPQVARRLDVSARPRQADAPRWLDEPRRAAERRRPTHGEPAARPPALRATARLQFHAGFTLDDAVPLVPYFAGSASAISTPRRS